ncbi:hypothetical protein [Telmatospirillum siberiense]|uniref:DUF2568 domain-containing protein n=1 Tax=Telmatospirillum siberiense TaxID=382514 RepID=A0A2N3PTE4_9PROT|nr:hypothetical protein [Telmatospirillum siberiense]PKU23656.1 hypothetical protein CWS72_15385 [Telmatospirillum siberiense]
MSAFLASGQAVDCILAVLLVEILVVGLRRGGCGAGQRLISMIIAALPGGCLLLALKAALSGAGPMWVGIWLALSFPTHLADLWRRPP